MMNAIGCKCGAVFAACVSQYIDAEWKLQEAYYKAQGCLLIQQEKVSFSDCACEHRNKLEHEFENLIEEIKAECWS